MNKIILISLLIISCHKEKPIEDDKSFSGQCSPKDYINTVINNKEEFQKEYTGKLTCEEKCDTGSNGNEYWLHCLYINKEFYKSFLACTNVGCYWINN